MLSFFVGSHGRRADHLNMAKLLDGKVNQSRRAGNGCGCKSQHVPIPTLARIAAAGVMSPGPPYQPTVGNS
jgi:hypothetical protein